METATGAPGAADTAQPASPAAAEPEAGWALALASALCGGDRRALAQALSELETGAPRTAALLRALQPTVGRARVLGITGPPGAGKSTLTNALISELRRNGERVGVIAVDPSSPVSKGAILGDRIRMTAALDDEGVFVRSLASRGDLGGLSPAAVRLIDALDAAGYGTILIETVGTGQSEIDIAEVADVRIVVAAPGLGDGIQAMKAGLLEIADVLVVNKADRPGAEQTAEQLLAALNLQPGREGVRLVRTSALHGTGITELLVAVLAAPGLGLAGWERRRRRAGYLVRKAALAEARRRLDQLGEDRLARLAAEVLDGRLSAEDAGRRVLEHGSH